MEKASDMPLGAQPVDMPFAPACLVPAVGRVMLMTPRLQSVLSAVDAGSTPESGKLSSCEARVPS